MIVENVESLVVSSSIPGKGRGLITTRDIKAGEVVLIDRPTVLIVDEGGDIKSHVCSNCFRMSKESLHRGTQQKSTSSVTSVIPSSSSLIPCSSCNQVWYCNSSCKEADFSSHHNDICSILSQIDSLFIPLISDLNLPTSPSSSSNTHKQEDQEDDVELTITEVKTSLRFLISVYSLKKKSLDASLPSEIKMKAKTAFEGVMSLCDPTKKDQNIEVTQRLHQFLLKTFGSTIVSSSYEETAALIRKDRCNSYGIMAPNDPEGNRRVRGAGTYCTASLVNHECIPNVCRYDYFDSSPLPSNGSESAGSSGNNQLMQIRALIDIPMGTEILSSYFPIDWPFAVRQERLGEEYGFSCHCSRCQIESQWSDDEEEEEEEWSCCDPNGNCSGRGHHQHSNRKVKGKGKEEDEGKGKGKGKEDTKGKKRARDSEEDQEEEEEEGKEQDQEHDTFAHGVFFVKHLCTQSAEGQDITEEEEGEVEECGGTMSPLPGSYRSKSDRKLLSRAEVEAKASTSADGKSSIRSQSFWSEFEYVPAEFMECNACGYLRSFEELEKMLAMATPIDAEYH